MYNAIRFMRNSIMMIFNSLSMVYRLTLVLIVGTVFVTYFTIDYLRRK